MKKNVASQVVGAQMVSATDGSAFTGSVTVSVTGDGGTQATGSVGSGACTHEGNGFHTYAPSQAETNHDHVAFTFTGTGAIPATVQIYPTFPQTGDSFARLGAPAGASVSADIAAIESQTDDIGVAGAGLTAIPWNSAWDAEVQSEVTDALNAYDPPTRTEATSDKDEILTAVADVPTNAELTTALAGADDAVLAAIAGLNDLSAAQVNAEVDTAISDAALATAANLTTVDTVVDAIKAKTDSLTFTVAGQVDANIESINTVTITGDGQVGTEFGVA
jgi:hypothetical protein